MRILITGSRLWTDAGIIGAALDAVTLNVTPSMVTVVHGTAQGADNIADREAYKRGFAVERHPADWETHGRRAGYLRNQEMVDLGADVCLAFPLGESKGTRMTMELAHNAELKVISFEPEPPSWKETVA